MCQNRRRRQRQQRSWPCGQGAAANSEMARGQAKKNVDAMVKAGALATALGFWWQLLTTRFFFMWWTGGGEMSTTPTLCVRTLASTCIIRIAQTVTACKRFWRPMRARLSAIMLSTRAQKRGIPLFTYLIHTAFVFARHFYVPSSFVESARRA